MRNKLAQIVLIGVAVLGSVSSTADNLAKLSIEGPRNMVGTGNGNPSSHEPYKATQRMASKDIAWFLYRPASKPVK